MKKTFNWLAQLACLLVFILAVASCDNEPSSPEFTPPDSSYGLIYSKIFEPSCGIAGCHDGSTTYPTLSGETTFQSIVDAAVQNSSASSAGLQLIMPSTPDSSFVYQKMIFNSSAFQFGSPMPQGGLTVSDDAKEFMRQWIAAGAPESGHVADRTLIE